MKLEAKQAKLKQIQGKQTKALLGKLGEKTVRLAFQEKFFGENLLRVSKAMQPLELVDQQILSIVLPS